MLAAALQPISAWAEDRATLRSDPSAVPGAKTDGAARCRPVLHSPHRDWHQSDKPSEQDAATAMARCLSPLANSNQSTFQFPLNQDKAIRDGVPPIELVDGEKLLRMLEELELGLIPKKTYELNAHFFDEFRS